MVTSGDWKQTVEIDSDIFDDPHTEACTRVIEILSKKKKISLSCVMLCRAENSIILNSFNTYKILINAGYHISAEILRKALIQQTGHDWAKEPLKNKK
jgi:hypothetical protein